LKHVINLLKDNYNGTEFKYIESRYIDKQRRKEIYDDYRRENSKIQSVTRGRKSEKTNKSNGYVEGEIRSDGKQDSRNDNNVYTEEITGKELDDYLKDSVKEILQDWGISPSEFEPITKPESSGGTVTQQSAITKNILNQLLAHLKSNKFKLHFSAEMKEYLKSHKLEYLQQAITYGKEHPYENANYRGKIPEILSIVKAKKYNKSGTDAVTLDSENHSIIYLIDHSADGELADNLKDGEGFGIRAVYNVNTITKDDIREIIRNIANDYGGSEVSIRHRLQNLGFRQEDLSGIDITTELKMVSSPNDNMVLSRRREWASSNNNRSSSNGREGTKGSRLEDRAGKDGIEFFTTPQGEIYGFVTKDGEIYLDETVISPEHPIHEYTHLWDRMVQQQNPELWKRGVELMKKTSMWTEIANDIHYGKLWEQQGITGTELEDRIASEVHARFTGEGGAKLLDQIAKEKGSEGIIAKLKDWIKEFWSTLKATFSNWSKEDLDKLTLKDFNHMTVRDFADGVNFENLSQQSQPTSVTALYQKQAGEYANVGDYTKIHVVA
jgi:hypothetical protein